MSFYIYDIVFLVAFVIFSSIFLYTRKHNLKKEGIMFIYRTSWGIKLINSIGKKNPGFLNFLSYVSITIGYLLTVGIIYLIGRIVYVYATRPDIVQAIKVPPVVPLVPYLTEIPSLSFLPPFYFTYWIVIIAIVAITHEMAHGIFMRRYNIKIKSTGFAFFPSFFPIFPAAFVEQDEKSMNKSKKFEQLAVLSAGTFANILTAIVFFAIIFVFFSLAFTPSGVVFDNYAYDLVDTSSILAVNGMALQNQSYERIVDSLNETGLNKITTTEGDFVSTKSNIERQSPDFDNLILYYDAPAINNDLESVIFEINGASVSSLEDLQNELSKYSPGDEITLNVLSVDGEDFNRDIVLGENPVDGESPWLGISFSPQTSSGALGKVYSAIAFKEPNIYYESKIGDFGTFTYNLLWWIILISVSVALINMLPVGIFDGGRFFYLTVWGITKNEKIARNAFAVSTYLILALFAALMFLWVYSFF